MTSDFLNTCTHIGHVVHRYKPWRVWIGSLSANFCCNKIIYPESYLHGYHEYSAFNIPVLICTVLLHPHARTLTPFHLSPCSPRLHPSGCCPPPCPLCSSPAMPSPPFTHSSSCCLVFHHPMCTSCFWTAVSWARRIEFQSHLRLQEQQHLNPLPDTS